MSWDVVVVGAGHNGLTAAALLARAGRKVLVLERDATHGGLARREEFVPGYRAPGVWQDTGGVRRALLEGLDLEAHGLRWRRDDPGALTPLAEAERGGLVLHRDAHRTARGLAEHAGADAAAYERWAAFVERVAPLVRGNLERVPPAVLEPRAGDLARLAREGLELRRLGARDMLALLRVLALSAADWLREHFASAELQAALAASALPGSGLGPRAVGTSALLLLARCAEGPGVEGGPAAVADALHAAARAHGAEVRFGVEAASLRVVDGRVAEVVARDGERFETRAVAASCDPRRVLLDMLPATSLPLSTETALSAYRLRGDAAVVRLALDAPLELAGQPGQRFETVRTATSLDELERCADALKYRALPARPWLDLRVPTVSDPSLAPEGGHVVTAHVHGVAHGSGAAPDGSWTDEQRALLFESVLAALERVAPHVSRHVVGHELLVPEDLERRYGVCGGHLLHGDHGLDQLWVLRPALTCSRYETPVRGLFLCGSGSHPGGGLTCAPGALAARRILWP